MQNRKSDLMYRCGYNAGHRVAEYTAWVTKRRAKLRKGE